MFMPKTQQNILLPIVVTWVLGRLQTDSMDIRTKPDGKYIWILHPKDHFSKFNIFYLLKKKKPSGISHYIGRFRRYWSMTEILWCNNVRDFKNAILIFFKKNDIKLISRRSRTPRTQEFMSRSILRQKVNFKIGKQSIISEAENIEESEYARQSSTKLMSFFL